jgi:hypothetical protein
MPRDSHQKWAEFHLRAAHAHLAPTQHGKQDHLDTSSSDKRLSTPPELSQNRMQFIRNPQIA